MTTLETKRKLLIIFAALVFVMIFLIFRILYIQIVDGEMLQARAFEQHTRDRLIRPDRGNIYDRNMVGLAMTQTVAAISVIRAQVEEPKLVARTLSEILEIDFDEVMEKVTRRVALERISYHVDLETADYIRELSLAGVVIDEDIKRVYPFYSLAAQVIGFVGADNQGIIGLESKYDSFLAGGQGKILTETDARGREFVDSQIIRIEPTPGDNLVTTLDYVVQQYAQQIIAQAVYAKDAIRGAIIVLNPQTGEILAMANEPTFDLNQPFTINNPELYNEWQNLDQQTQLYHLNQMWRNFTINDCVIIGLS